MWWLREKKDVTEFLYRLLVAEAPSRGYARQVAARMRVPYPTLSKYWLGRRFPASLVRSLFEATDCDPRVADFFLLEGTGYRLARSEPTTAPADLGRAVAQLGALVGRVTGAYLGATEPDSPAGAALSRDEAAELATAMSAVVRLAEELRAALEGATRAGT